MRSIYVILLLNCFVQAEASYGAFVRRRDHAGEFRKPSPDDPPVPDERTDEELIGKVDELRKEVVMLREAKQSGTLPETKKDALKDVEKQIEAILMLYQQRQVYKVKEHFAGKPLQLIPKRFRGMKHLKRKDRRAHMFPVREGAKTNGVKWQQRAWRPGKRKVALIVEDGNYRSKGTQNWIAEMNLERARRARATDVFKSARAPAKIDAESAARAAPTLLFEKPTKTESSPVDTFVDKLVDHVANFFDLDATTTPESRRRQW